MDIATQHVPDTIVGIVGWKSQPHLNIEYLHKGMSLVTCLHRIEVCEEPF
jgi:hypothetical protein